MARQHTGRPGATPIHPDFTDAHRAVAEATHTAACTIRHPGGTASALDPVTGRRTIAPNAPHYTGPCSISRLPASETTPVAGEEVVPSVQFLVAIGWDAAVSTVVGDTVTITSPGPHADAMLAGVQLVVASSDHDSVSWERVLRCTQNQS